MAFPSYTGCAILSPMSGERNYFREWRRKRGLTQAQVVARLEAMEDPDLPKTEASLSRIEAGKQNYRSNLLHALADIYQCDVWELHGRNPLVEGQLIDLVNRLDPAFHTAAAAMLNGLIVSQERQSFTAAEPEDPDGRLRPRRKAH